MLSSPTATWVARWSPLPGMTRDFNKPPVVDKYERLKAHLLKTFKLSVPKLGSESTSLVSSSITCSGGSYLHRYESPWIIQPSLIAALWRRMLIAFFLAPRLNILQLLWLRCSDAWFRFCRFSSRCIAGSGHLGAHCSSDTTPLARVSFHRSVWIFWLDTHGPPPKACPIRTFGTHWVKLCFSGQRFQ